MKKGTIAKGPETLKGKKDFYMNESVLIAMESQAGPSQL